MKNYISKKYSRGFTLLETLIAISLLSVAVLGVFNAVQSGLQNTSYSKDQITAFFMAQEGMEYIKNIRDENALRSIAGQATTWLTGLSAGASDACFFGKTCRIDSPAKTVVDCSGDAGGVCKNLGQDTVSGLYGYTAGWPATSFKRSIQFQSVRASEVLVLMTITWTTRGITHSFQVTESFFDR